MQLSPQQVHSTRDLIKQGKELECKLLLLQLGFIFSEHDTLLARAYLMLSYTGLVNTECKATVEKDTCIKFHILLGS